MFSENSRYKDVKEYTPVDSKGEKHKVKRIRFIPSYQSALPHMIKEGDRLDHVSQKYFGDPTKYWLIVDVNDEMVPHDLIKAGKKIIIPKERG